MPSNSELSKPSARAVLLRFAARALATALLSLLGLTAATSPAGAATTEPGAKLIARTWSDGRIVFGASCIQLDASKTARYACKVEYAKRPAAIAPAQWERLSAAVRAGDFTKFGAVMGIAPTATEAESDAIFRRWGFEDTTFTMVGYTRTGATWKVSPSPLSIEAFTSIAKVQATIRGAIPSMEQWYADHGTYATATGTKIRTYDPGLPRDLVVVATKNAYCISWTVGSVTMSLHRPVSTWTIGNC